MGHETTTTLMVTASAVPPCPVCGAPNPFGTDCKKHR